MIKKIYLDIDGVLNRFQWYIFQRLGVPMAHEDQYPVEAGWDIVQAANILLGEDRYSKTSFWNSVTREMWANTPTSDIFSLLIGTCEQLVGQENICILTSPTLDADCVAGKVEWMQRFLPKWMHRNFLIGPPKHECAQPGRVLIDDADKNVAAFNAAGGKGILVPRPWNTLHGRDPLTHVTRELLKTRQETWPKSLSVVNYSN